MEQLMLWRQQACENAWSHSFQSRYLPVSNHINTHYHASRIQSLWTSKKRKSPELLVKKWDKCHLIWWNLIFKNKN